MRINTVTLILAVIIGLGGWGGCKNPSVNSGWSEGLIVVDGNDQEWRNIQFVPSKERAALGIMNDADNLYISFRTADQATILHTLNLGLTIWVDPDGKNNQVFGIKYPVGSGPGEMRGMMRGGRDSYEERDRQIEFLLQSQNIVDIYGSDGSLIRRLPVLNDSGIIVKPGYIQGQFIYEVQIPLAVINEQTGGTPMAPDATIGIGFIAGDIDMEDMREHMLPQRGGGMDDPPGGGGMDGPPGGGMGGFPGGSRGGGPIGRNPGMLESMNIWFKVKLAVKP